MHWQKILAMGIIPLCAAFARDATGKAVLKIKEDGIFAGVDVAEKIFRFMQPGHCF